MELLRYPVRSRLMHKIASSRSLKRSKYQHVTHGMLSWSSKMKVGAISFPVWSFSDSINEKAMSAPTEAPKDAAPVENLPP